MADWLGMNMRVQDVIVNWLAIAGIVVVFAAALLNWPGRIGLALMLLSWLFQAIVFKETPIWKQHSRSGSPPQSSQSR